MAVFAVVLCWVGGGEELFDGVDHNMVIITWQVFRCGGWHNGFFYTEGGYVGCGVDKRWQIRFVVGWIRE